MSFFQLVLILPTMFANDLLKALVKRVRRHNERKNVQLPDYFVLLIERT